MIKELELKYKLADKIERYYINRINSIRFVTHEMIEFINETHITDVDHFSPLSILLKMEYLNINQLKFKLDIR